LENIFICNLNYSIVFDIFLLDKKYFFERKVNLKINLKQQINLQDLILPLIIEITTVFSINQKDT
jgi:hypothetical protein